MLLTQVMISETDLTSNNYKSFSKISDGMEGSVKFVMSTASIEKDDDK